MLSLDIESCFHLALALTDPAKADGNYSGDRRSFCSDEVDTCIESFLHLAMTGRYWSVKSPPCFHMKCFTVLRSMLGSSTYGHSQSCQM